MDKRRVDWIDVAKCLGIFAIYLGHVGGTKLGYEFVFRFHVALFFLISGCTEYFNKERRLFPYIQKKVINILLPTFFFALVSAVIHILFTDGDIPAIKAVLLQIGKGLVRNSFVAPALWFMTCLFVMEIMFFLLRKIKISFIVFGICAGLFVIADRVMNPRPIVSPSWIFNIDSACYYIVFYAIGFYMFPYLAKLFAMDTGWKKLITVISGSFSFLYAILSFENIDVLIPIAYIPVVGWFYPVIRSTVLIYFLFVAARLMEKINVFQNIGKNTLYLCGSEWIIKTVFTYFAAIVGVSINITTPGAAYIYVIILIVLANKYMVPIEKCILDRIKKCIPERQRVNEK